MPLPTGDWESDVDGARQRLHIGRVDADGGQLSECTLGGQPISGFWDERTRRIAFSRETAAGPQVFTGFFFIDDRGPASVGPFENRLAGFFESFEGPPERVLRGWYAQQSAPFPGGRLGG